MEKNDEAISRADVRHLIAEVKRKSLYSISSKAFEELYNGIDDLPPILQPFNPTETVTESAERSWIPVSERLPEKSGRYLCTHGGTYLRGIDFYETPNDALKDEIGDSGWRSQNVIAWMPLPEPYKPESEVRNESNIRHIESYI